MTEEIKNFIVLDDDAVNNMICRKIILNVFPEVSVLTFTDPDIAISYIVSTYQKVLAPTTVLFLDINMPIISGWDFLDAFDRFDIRVKTHLRIFMLTSSFDYSDKERAAENINVSGYFEKPLTREKIKSIETVLNNPAKPLATDAVG